MAERTLPFRPATTHRPQRHNVGQVDRWVSGLVGGLMLRSVGRRQSALGKAWALTGGTMLLARAATGHSRVYDAMGVSTARLAEGGGLSIETATTVNRPREELYRFWREPSNLPLVLGHVESVTGAAEGVTHWTVRGPRNLKIEWDAAMMNEEPYERIAWHSMEGSQIEQTGSVQFADAGDKGTEIRLKLRYVPPGGLAGFLAARVLNSITEAQVAQDLRRFKHTMEAGVDIVAESTPSGRQWAGADVTTSKRPEAGPHEPAGELSVPAAEQTESMKPAYVPDLP